MLIAEFSIVIPVYNAQATLAQSLNTVTEQSFKKIEVIIVDDGSTDNSLSIAQAWQSEQEFPVKIIRQKNKGLGAARNAGIAKARKDFVALLDADDLWTPNRLEILADFVHNFKIGILYNNVESFGVTKPRKRRIYQLYYLRDLLLKGNPLVPSACVFPRHLLVEFPFTENRRYHGAEDLHLWIRLMKARSRVEFMDKTLTLYRESGGMSTNLEQHLEHVFNLLKDFHEENLLSKELYTKAVQRKHFEAGRFYQKRKKFRQARKHYAKGRFYNEKDLIFPILNLLHIAV